MSKSCQNCEKIKAAGLEGYCYDCYSHAIHQLQKEWDEMAATAGREAIEATALRTRLNSADLDAGKARRAELIALGNLGKERIKTDELRARIKDLETRAADTKKANGGTCNHPAEFWGGTEDGWWCWECAWEEENKKAAEAESDIAKWKKGFEEMRDTVMRRTSETNYLREKIANAEIRAERMESVVGWAQLLRTACGSDAKATMKNIVEWWDMCKALDIYEQGQKK